MSGGIAYVLDEAGDFEIRCNQAMVDIERISATGVGPLPEMDMGSAMADMLGDDEARLRFLVERHLKFTGSARARTILDSWGTYLPKFVKVLPVDYRRALLDMRAAQGETQINLAAGE
ncbi:MAG: glutamate synthase large subunit, partial [Rhodospirillales bacterium]|nr:glutamate synthase large subunit [Rhodospirillales bacterium]